MGGKTNLVGRDCLWNWRRNNGCDESQNENSHDTNIAKRQSENHGKIFIGEFEADGV